LRFPVPGPSTTALKIVTGMGYRVTSYNLDSQDYNYVNDTGNRYFGQIFINMKATLDQILPPSRGSFIAIQRDIVRSSVEQTEAILKYAIEKKGYKAVRMDDCLKGAGFVGGGNGGNGGLSAGGIDVGTDSKDGENGIRKQASEADRNYPGVLEVITLAILSLLTALLT